MLELASVMLTEKLTKKLHHAEALAGFSFKRVADCTSASHHPLLTFSTE
jgi:hypothetical protein